MNTLVKSMPRYTQIIPLSDSPFGRVSTLWQSKSILLLSFLIAAVFLSAISVVYNQEDNRMLFNQLTSLQKNRDNLFVTWGQLLLEESTWTIQSRVEKIATEKFNMIVPDQKNIVIVRQ